MSTDWRLKQRVLNEKNTLFRYEMDKKGTVQQMYQERKAICSVDNSAGQETTDGLNVVLEN